MRLYPLSGLMVIRYKGLSGMEQEQEIKEKGGGETRSNAADGQIRD